MVIIADLIIAVKLSTIPIMFWFVIMGQQLQVKLAL